MVSSRNEQIEILRNAIEMEIDGKEFFTEMANRAEHPNARKMYDSLALQEQRHIEVLNEELSRLEKGSGWISPSSVKSDSKDTPSDSVFRGKSRSNLTMDPKAGELDAIKLGIEIEKRSIEYYREAGTEVKGIKAKEVFNWLVGEEAGHLTILRAEYDHRARSGFYFDTPEFSLEVM
ncbi:MAG: ferritin family protein [Methanobacteriota archaeon]|nr:MAG: ferritin family protein [Euryarchaeota archaeon]